MTKTKMGLIIRRKRALSQKECFLKLGKGYILENEHGFTVFLRNGKQYKSNPRRFKRDYKFDFATWLVVGRISLWQRFGNFIAECRG